MRFIKMRIRFVYGIFPAFIKYTDNMDAGTGGYASRMFICIRPRYLHDEGIHVHELTHVKQWYRNPLFHRWNYSNSEKSKLEYELEAYAAQFLAYPELEREGKIQRFAYFLANKYGLNITEQNAEIELRRVLDI